MYVQMPYSGGPRTHAVSSLDLWHESLVSPASLSFTFVDTADARARAHSQQMPFRISRPRLLPNPAAYGSPARLSTYVLVWTLQGAFRPRVARVVCVLTCLACGRRRLETGILPPLAARAMTRSGMSSTARPSRAPARRTWAAPGATSPASCFRGLRWEAMCESPLPFVSACHACLEGRF